MWLLDGPPTPGPNAEPAVQHWACSCGSKFDVRSPSPFVTVGVFCQQCGGSADIIPGPEPATGG